MLVLDSNINAWWADHATEVGYLEVPHPAMFDGLQAWDANDCTTTCIQIAQSTSHDTAPSGLLLLSWDSVDPDAQYVAPLYTASAART